MKSPSDTPPPAAASRLPYSGKRLFYGWVIVGVGFISQLIQGLVAQGFASYLDLLKADFHWTSAQLAAPRSVTTVENAALGPLTGWLVDRFGPRKVVAVGVVLVGIGFVIFGLTTTMWLFYLANIVMALGTCLMGLFVMSVAVNNWFRRRRTIAQSVMLLGYSLAGVLGVPGLVFLQTKLGWQGSAFWTGIGVMAIGLPCTLLLRTRPEAHGLLPDGDRPGQAAAADGKDAPKVEYDFTVREALRTRSFWLLALGLAASNVGMGAVQVHIFLHLEQSAHLARETTALVVTISAVANIPFRLVGGYLGDRVNKSAVLGIATILMGASFLALAVAGSFQAALLYAIPYGIGWGIRTPVMNSMQADYFGRRALGKISGWLQLVSLPFAIAAPVIAGLMDDVQETYLWAFIMMAAITVVGAVLILLAARPRVPRTG